MKRVLINTVVSALSYNPSDLRVDIIYLESLVLDSSFKRSWQLQHTNSTSSFQMQSVVIFAYSSADPTVLYERMTSNFTNSVLSAQFTGILRANAIKLNVTGLSYSVASDLPVYSFQLSSTVSPSKAPSVGDNGKTNKTVFPVSTLIAIVILVGTAGISCIAFMICVYFTERRKTYRRFVEWLDPQVPSPREKMTFDEVLPGETPMFVIIKQTNPTTGEQKLLKAEAVRKNDGSVGSFIVTPRYDEDSGGPHPVFLSASQGSPTQGIEGSARFPHPFGPPPKPSTDIHRMRDSGRVSHGNPYYATDFYQRDEGEGAMEININTMNRNIPKARMSLTDLGRPSVDRVRHISSENQAQRHDYDIYQAGLTDPDEPKDGESGFNLSLNPMYRKSDISNEDRKSLSRIKPPPPPPKVSPIKDDESVSMLSQQSGSRGVTRRQRKSILLEKMSQRTIDAFFNVPQNKTSPSPPPSSSPSVSPDHLSPNISPLRPRGRSRSDSNNMVSLSASNFLSPEQHEERPEQSSQHQRVGPSLSALAPRGARLMEQGSLQNSDSMI